MYEAVNASIFSNCFGYKDKELEKKYQTWKHDATLMHITVISAITGILYIFYTIVSIYAVPSSAINLMITLHILGVALPLFLISFFAYHKKHYKLILLVMMIAPIIATILHNILLTYLDWESIYFPEVYLILIWTFAISGLPFLQASISAFIILIITTVNMVFMSHLSHEILIMHLFWLLISFILGFVGAFLLERQHKINFTQHQILHNLATIDTLTEVYNRTQFREFLQSELDETKLRSYVFGLMMIDIDFFKEVNDKYGHQMGDEVLKTMAQLLKQNIRKTDTIIRWGGEEFMIICQAIEKDELIHFTDEIRKIIEAYSFGNIGKRTISIGITCSDIDDTVDSLLSRVDIALHQAKENGRNMVIYH